MANPLAYGYPGPPPGYGWAPIHSANPPSESDAALCDAWQEQKSHTLFCHAVLCALWKIIVRYVVLCAVWNRCVYLTDCSYAVNLYGAACYSKLLSAS